MTLKPINEFLELPSANTEPNKKATVEIQKESQVHSLHTPGRWDWGPSGGTMEKDYSQPFAVHQWGELNLIAGTFGDVKGGPEVAEANAKRIVQCVNAFDDLLAALKAVVSDLEHGTTGRWKGDGSKSIRAAIRKAEQE